MEKKGSVTVFLSLILSLFLSLVCTSIESARMAAARTQILNSLDIGLYSLFGQYDRAILEDYDLFLLDGSSGGGELKMGNVYRDMEAYMKPVLKQNSQKLSVVQGGFTGYRLATDENGEVFYQQAVQYMRDTLGLQGVQLLLGRMDDRTSKTREAEQAGTQAEEGERLESYEREMSNAAQNSREALEQQGSGAQGEGGDFTSGKEGGGGSTQAVNPIGVIKRIRKMGILELVIPQWKAISDRMVQQETLLSGRALQTGLSMPGSVTRDTSYTSQVLFQQYLLDKLGNFSNPAKQGLQYQIEYILHGRDSDMENLKSVAKKLMVVREGVNLASLAASPEKRAQTGALALAIASSFLIPPAAAVIEAALILCWSFAESILDVRELFAGGKVPLVKAAADWQISLENLPNLLDGLDSRRRGTDDGMSYEDYLQVFLLTKSREEKLRRGMDMVEQSIRGMEGRESFRLDSCLTALEASVDVKANRRKTFTVMKQYCYD